MRRRSVPKPRDERRHSMPRGKSKLDDSRITRAPPISEDDKENVPKNNNNDDDNDDNKRNDGDRNLSEKSDENKNEEHDEESDDKTDNDMTHEKSGLEKETIKENEKEDQDNSSAVAVDESESKDEKEPTWQDEGEKESLGKTMDGDGSLESSREMEDDKNENGNDDWSMTKAVEDNDDDKGVDATDNEVDNELLTDENNTLSEKELEEEWKKLTEDPNYPSIPSMDDLTTRRSPPPQSTTNQTTPNIIRDDVTRATSQSRHTASVPPLHIPESVRWTHQTVPTYTSSRAITDIPYSSFSYQTKHPIRLHTSRRHSIPKPLPSSKEPNNYNSQNYTNDKDSNFMDDNSMLVSARKLDGLLFRLFYKSPNIQNSTHVQENDRQHASEKSKAYQNSTLPVLEQSGSDIISMDPVTWQIRPMGAVEKETLQSELPYLEENLDAKEVIKKLFMEGVITHLDYNQLTHTEGQGSRAVTRLLIGTLQRRGERAYPVFMQALKDLNRTRVYDKLYSTEREISRGMDDDRDELERRTKMEGMEGHSPTLGHDLFAPSTTNHAISSSPTDNRLDAKSSTPQPPQRQEESNPRDSKREDYDREVEKQLTELNAELKALHEDINFLRSSRSGATPDDQQPPESRNNPGVPQKSSSCVML